MRIIVAIIILLSFNVSVAINTVEHCREIKESPFQLEVKYDYIYPIGDTNLKRVTSPFGYRIDPIKGGRKFHSGIDIACPIGTPIVAVADGRGYTYKDSYGGIHAIIYHNDSVRCIYGHLSESFVVYDSIFKQGDTIGYSGMTGYATGLHLHFEIREIM
jgi:murein DD-endopeptidase MepM/ murein hydrolase activator NlpD